MDVLDFVPSIPSDEEIIDADYADDEASQFEGERCGICLDVVIDRGVLDCCQHWFCFTCIDNWSTITNLCPLCQNEFQMITCIPVYDTIGSNKFDEESSSREEDWCIEGDNNALSFPSYYIDEDAVICLDGSGCKIRGGEALSEGYGSEDTSIACDSCDIWYHAFCVGFDPEGESETWSCPRCMANDLPQTLSSSSIQASSCNHENASNEFVFQNAFSGKVSVSVADSGETALVVSILPGNQVDHMPNDDVKMASMENTCISCSDAKNVEDEHLYLPTPCGISSDMNVETDSGTEILPSMSCSKELFEEFCAHKESGTAWSCHGVDIGVQSTVSLSPAAAGGARDDQENNAREGNPTKGEHLNFCGVADPLISEAGVTKSSNETKIEVEKKDGLSSWQERDDALPFKYQNGTIMRLENEKKDEQSYWQERDDALPFNYGNGAIVRLEDDNGELNQEKSTDIMSIVRGTRKSPFDGHEGSSLAAGGNAARIRVKKIMRRTAMDKDSSMVQNLREEIREAARNKSSNIEENLSDRKLLAAFRAIITGTEVESMKKISRSAVKAKKSLLQKGKVRESLTRKIYATNTGKRKRAWDRECDVEFWKYRCMRTTKPEKMETLKSVLDILRGSPMDSLSAQESEQQPTRSILSRLYLADTSVMPRKDDVKPVTALEAVTGKESQFPWEDQASRSMIAATKNASKSGPSASQVSKNKTTNSKHDPAGGKISTSGSAGHPISQLDGSKGTVMKATVATTDDLKSDKRKWALEILARKSASLSKGGSADGHQENDWLKGNYPLLAQLPVDMRPAPAAARHNKIPISVRQTQLYRLTEHFLRKADSVVICRNAETELAVADAINVEMDVADRSSSKLVYVNLCSQMLLRRQEDKKSNDTMPSCLSSATGAPHNGELEVAECPDSEISGALRSAGLLSDSPPDSPLPESEPFKGELEICMTEVEAASDSVVEASGTPDPDVCPGIGGDLGGEECPIVITCTTASLKQPRDDGTTASAVASFTTDSENAANELLPLKDKIDAQIGTLGEELAAVIPYDSGHPSADDKCGNSSLSACDGSYDPGKESQGKKESDEEATEGRSKPCSEKKQSPGKDDEQHNEKGDNDARKSSESIRKKVEAYVKEHIRPLCKSGVITAEQYRWSVAKTAEKR